MMKVEKVAIEKIKSNPKNPRVIRDDNFKKLVRSLLDFPEMMQLRPIVVDESGMVLGGNMRLKAASEAGLEDVWVARVELDDDKKKEFLVKDNINYGKWDYLLLKDYEALEEWGMVVPEWFNGPEDTDDDDFFSDFDWSETPSSSTTTDDGGGPASRLVTYLLLNLEEKDADFIKRMEQQILKKTETEDMSKAIYKIIKKNG